MAGAPRVSVVIPVHDREVFVGEAIESLFAQTLCDFEIVVVDDGSTDRTREVVESYQDARVRLVSHPCNQGIARARNTGVGAARGEYLAFLDSDDIAHPARLEKQVGFLDRHPDHAAIGSWIDWMDEQGRPLGRVKRRPIAWADVAAQRLFHQGIENTASMARTEVLRAYPHDETYAVGEDFDLWSRVAAVHPVANLPEVLVRRRAHAGQSTGSKDNRKRRHRESVYSRQLEELGIAFGPEDIERHDRLRRLRKLRYVPDSSYVGWAEDWLRALQSANARVSSYPEPAFSELLGGLWLNVCWRAAPALGRGTAWRRFRSSSLHRWAWPGLRNAIWLNAPRRQPGWKLKDGAT